MTEIKLEKRYPHSRTEDITDAFMRGYEKGKADRPQGKWRKHDNERDYCSRCKYIFKTRTITQQDKWTRYIDDLGYNFCPNCGADMREREGE